MKFFGGKKQKLILTKIWTCIPNWYNSNNDKVKQHPCHLPYQHKDIKKCYLIAISISNKLQNIRNFSSKLLLFTLNITISQSVSQFSPVAQLCLILCDHINRSTPGLPVHHQLPESTQTHAHQVGDAIQPSQPLSSPYPPAPNPSQHQGLFQWVNSSHEVAKVLEFQLQHQSFQWTPRTDLL